jgi:hypothetical protein
LATETFFARMPQALVIIIAFKGSGKKVSGLLNDET